MVIGDRDREIGPVSDGSPNWLTSTLQTIGGTFVTLKGEGHVAHRTNPELFAWCDTV